MYLIATQTLMDLICGEPKVTAWVDSVSTADVGVSIITLGRIEAEILETDLSDGREELDRPFRMFRSHAKRVQRIEPFDESTASTWARIMHRPLDWLVDGEVEPVDMPARMVVATAIERNLILVERTQPYHATFADLRVLDPYR